MISFNEWIRQPTTIHGIGVIAAGAAIAAGHIFKANPEVSALAGGVVYALVHLGIDDNSNDVVFVERVIEEVANAATAKETPNA